MKLKKMLWSASKIVWRGVRFYLIVVGVLFHVLVVWLGVGWPLYFDRWLIQSSPPREAEAIICLTGGLGANNFPTERGWQRIYTAVQLYLDGYAPWVIFSGGGSSAVSQGEVYAEVAGWLGLPEEVVVIDALSASTADHPANILKLGESPVKQGKRKKAKAGRENGRNHKLRISRESPLLIVTSPLHSRRVALCFRKAGFSRFRIVTHYSARGKGVEANRLMKKSRVIGYKPSGKRYRDFLFRLKVRTGYFLEALREVAAIALYWVQGKI